MIADLRDAIHCEQLNFLLIRLLLQRRQAFSHAIQLTLRELRIIEEWMLNEHLVICCACTRF